MNTRTNNNGKQDGFSMTEILVCMALTAATATGLYSGLSTGFGIVNLARQNLRATQIALEKMETVRMYSWDQVNSNGFIPPTFTAPFFPSSVAGVTNDGGLTYYGTTLITNAPFDTTYSNDVKLVVVTVNWTNGATLHQRQLSTYLSQYGMQRYIY